MTIAAAADEGRAIEAPPKIAGASSPIGLTSAEAERRRETFGPNAIPDVSAHALVRALEKFWSPVPWMLEGAIALEFVMGKYVEATVIGLLLVFNAALSYFQEGRAQATLAALKSRLAVTASVRRDGAWKLVPAAELVPGDAVKLTLGALVPADAKIQSGEVLLDQSLLTGESASVEAGDGATAYAGALIRRGEAIAEVSATGARTKFGRTAELVGAAHVVSTQQSTVFRVVRNIAAFNDFVAWRLRRARWRRREINYATRTQMACPRSRIRLSDLTAIETSVTRRASSRDFKISPITRL